MTPFALRPATADDAAAIATVIRTAKGEAMPWLAVPHTAEEDLAWVRDHLLVEQDVTVATVTATVVGVLATTPGWIEQLYVATAVQGRGVGTALLARALEHPGDQQLWTFRRNAPARRFYERAGFVAVEFTDGSGNEEREPDVRYVLRRT